MKNKIIVVIANDKITNALFSQINLNENVILALDRSSNVRRVIKLILRGSLPIISVLEMLFADLCRRKRKWKFLLSIDSNAELINLYNEYNPTNHTV